MVIDSNWSAHFTTFYSGSTDSILTYNITSWFRSCSFHGQQKQPIRTDEDCLQNRCCSCLILMALYQQQCIHTATSTIKDPLHPSLWSTGFTSCRASSGLNPPTHTLTDTLNPPNTHHPPSWTTTKDKVWTDLRTCLNYFKQHWIGDIEAPFTEPLKLFGY